MSRRTLTFALALFLMPPSFAAAATPSAYEGDWIGGFDGQDGTVYLSARFTPKGDELTGEIDLPVRGDHKVPLKRISASDSRLSFEIPGVNGSLLFEGRHKNGTVSGNVRQANAASRFEMIKLARLRDEQLAEVYGNYELEPGHVILITKSAAGPLYLDHTGGRMGVLYPIDERTFVSGPTLIAGYPVELTVTFEPGVAAPAPALPRTVVAGNASAIAADRFDDAAGRRGARVAGGPNGETDEPTIGTGPAIPASSVPADANSIGAPGASSAARVSSAGADAGTSAATGTATTAGASTGAPSGGVAASAAPSRRFSPALTWTPHGKAARRAPRKTFYTTESIGFYNGDVRLSASLLLPAGPGPHPAVVMIHGSGPVTRDVLHPYADVFARNGIAVLMPDKRGSGSSTGNWARATFDDLAGDALAGVDFLKTRPEINSRQIGLQGTSLGGYVAPLAATRSRDVAFVIVESAPAITPAEHERLRVRTQLRADGFSAEHIVQALAYMDQKFEVARTGQGWKALETAGVRGLREGWLSYVNAPSTLDSLQWHWQNVLAYDPVPALEHVTCPVLVLYGALDTLVPPSENRSRMEAALKRSGHPDVTIKVFDRANHSFFAAITGGRREAATLKGLVPGYLDVRLAWLRQRVTVSTAATAPPPTTPAIDGGSLFPGE